MRILLIHTHYQFKGGEDAVFTQEQALLEEDNEVKTLVFRNKSGWKGALQFLLSVWNPFAVASIKKRIRTFKPEVVHIHNWHYASGPAIIRAAKRMGVPVVLTLHNYRLLCPSGSLMNGSTIFTESMYANFPWKAVRLGVFRDSVIQTFWLAFVVWFHKKAGTWQLVDRYLVLTDFARTLYESSRLGIDPSRFVIKPNFAQRPEQQQLSRDQHFLYIGRLSDEKGVNVLLSTFRNTGYSLSIAGDGPLLDLVEHVSAVSSNIHYLGTLDKCAVQYAMQTCTALLFPSIWYETFGMVIIEAFALGCPVIASNIGSPIELVQNGINGLHFEAGNVDSLRNTLKLWVSLSQAEKEQYGKRARATYEQLYTPEINYQLLMGIYESATGMPNEVSVETQSALVVS
ncbi:glycosyltransferase [Spirosoma pulveris]